MGSHISNVRPKPDKVLVDIADYVLDYKIKSKEAIDTARYCLMDTLGCGLEALNIRHARSCSGQSCVAGSFRTAQRCRAPSSSWTP
jgi:2-methylcitrate dehydratase PrpD